MSDTITYGGILVSAITPLVMDGYMVSYNGADSISLHDSTGKQYAEIWYANGWKLRLKGKEEDFTFTTIRRMLDILEVEC